MYRWVAEEERFQTLFFIARVITNLSVYGISFLCVRSDSTTSMSRTLRDWIFVEQASITDLHLLHDFSPHADIKLHESWATSWTQSVMLGEESFRSSQLLRMAFKILTNLAVFVWPGCDMCAIPVLVLPVFFPFLAIILIVTLFTNFLLSSWFSIWFRTTP